MQKLQKLSWLAGISFSLFLIRVETPGLTQQEGLNFISEIKENVEIKRDGRKDYQRAYVGDLVNPWDRLRLGKGASAKVVCNNLDIWNLKSQGEFLVSQGCSSTTRTILTRPNSRRSSTRDGNDPTIPYLISPRNTAILTRQPTLLWNSIRGATSYQVRILGPGVNWKNQVREPTVVYTGNQPLQPKIRYGVTVTANNGASTENKDNTGFTVLSDEDAQRVKTEIARLQQQRLSNESKTLALAYLYRSNDLNAEAIDMLEKLSQQWKIVSVFQLLGSIYEQVGLNRLARERYLTALELAKKENNWEGQAIILASLGQVDIVLGELKQAFQWVQDAQASYRTLGDEGKVQELQQKLDDLKRRLPL